MLRDARFARERNNIRTEHGQKFSILDTTRNGSAVLDGFASPTSTISMHITDQKFQNIVVGSRIRIYGPAAYRTARG
jgi:hypothetical protein